MRQTSEKENSSYTEETTWRSKISIWGCMFLLLVISFYREEIFPWVAPIVFFAGWTFSNWIVEEGIKRNEKSKDSRTG